MSSPTSTSSKDDIRVVVSIDFGTTFSGFAYAHKYNPNEITVEDQWEGLVGFKTPTIIKYDESYSTVKSWGSYALPKRRNADQSKPIELFKLYLLNEPSMKLPPLPVDYRKVIADYLKQLSKMIKENVNNTWEDLDFYSQVLIILTIPTEFADDEIEIMRDCAYKAGLTKEKNSRFLVFITEPEAAAVYCLNASDEVKNLKPGESFMIVDCGGGTVDLTCHELLANQRISELTESKGENCGSSFVDKKFKEFLRNKLGEPTFELLENEYYNSLQYMVQEFCENVKIPFTGQNFKPYEIDLEDYPAKYPSTLKDIVIEGKEKKLLEKSEWMITLQHDDVKEMFDPLITRIVHLIKGQLDQLKNKNKRCSAMLLVGGFSESKYLQKIINTEFKNIAISFPPIPVVAVLKGGVQFGLKVETVAKRILKRTYGTNVVRRSRLNDPKSEMLPNGYTIVFEPLASRGDAIPVNDKVIQQFRLSSLTKRVNFDIYVTEKIDAKFCNDPEVSLFRHLEVELPENDESDDDDDDDDDYDDTIISLTLTFGTIEILATAKNQKTGKKYRINQKSRIKLQYE